MTNQPKPLSDKHTCAEPRYFMDTAVVETDDGPPQPRQAAFLMCAQEGCYFHLSDYGEIVAYIRTLERQLAETKRDAEWKHAFDEGEIVGMKSDTADTENPYPEGGNLYCGWSFGFWQSRDRKQLAAMRGALERIRDRTTDQWAQAVAREAAGEKP
jgi:hypothetical protein